MINSRCFWGVVSGLLTAQTGHPPQPSNLHALLVKTVCCAVSVNRLASALKKLARIARNPSYFDVFPITLPIV